MLQWIGNSCADNGHYLCNYERRLHGVIKSDLGMSVAIYSHRAFNNTDSIGPEVK